MNELKHTKIDVIDLNKVDKLVYPLFKNITLVSVDIYRYNEINNYFKSIDIDKVNKVVSIISREDRISLRMCDWFVTNYAAVNSLVINNTFNIHSSYKAQLVSYRKKNFDPFRRNKAKNVNNKFYYMYDKQNPNMRILTTIAQLNFFKWATLNGVIKYIDDNYDILNTKMLKVTKFPIQKKIKKTFIPFEEPKNRTLEISF